MRFVAIFLAALCVAGCDERPQPAPPPQVIDLPVGNKAIGFTGTSGSFGVVSRPRRRD